MSLNIRERQELDALQKTVAEMSEQFAGFDKRLKRLERVWERYRKRLGAPLHLGRPVPQPPRPQILKDLGLGHDPPEVSTDG